jgi:serine protease AprX
MAALKMIRRMLLLAACIVCAAGFAGIPVSGEIQAAEASQPEDSVLSASLLSLLDQLDSGEPVPVIVTTVKSADAADEEEARGAGAAVHRRFTHLDGYAAWISAGSMRRLARGRNVRNISYDLPVRPTNDLNFVAVGADLAAAGFGADGYGLDGRGVTVAVVDSGIASHPDVAGRLLAEVEIVGHEKGFADPYGHGTHVAGIIAGDGSASADGGAFRRFGGIAPAAGLVSVRVLDGDGNGRVSDVMAGIDWVVANKDLYGIRVMNLSLGHPADQPYRDDPLCQAVERAWEAGIVVVTAAGNDGAEGYGTIHSPADDARVITVGASNNYQTGGRSDDIMTTYTSRGPSLPDHVVKPDLVAPGNRTISLRAEGSTLDAAHPELRVKQETYRDDPAAAGLDSPYFQMSGSSMAAGVVSGMAILMIQADPSLTPDTVKARLMKSAEKRAGYDIFSEGAGFADLASALATGGAAAGPALSPVATWTGNGIVIQETGDLWGDAAAWGGEAIWGSDPLRGTGSVWADPILWSDASGGTPDGTAPGNAGANSIVWGGNKKSSGTAAGSSIVWGGGGKSKTTATGSSIVWGGNAAADSIVWGGNVAADSIVWGGNAKSSFDTTLQGDSLPAAP